LLAGKPRRVSLGPVSLSGLQEARAKAIDARPLRYGGTDPIEARCATNCEPGSKPLRPSRSGNSRRMAQSQAPVEATDTALVTGGIDRFGRPSLRQHAGLEAALRPCSGRPRLSPRREPGSLARPDGQAIPLAVAGPEGEPPSGPHGEIYEADVERIVGPSAIIGALDTLASAVSSVAACCPKLWTRRAFPPLSRSIL